MFSILALATTATTPLDTPTMLPCDGVRLIEASTSDSPVAFSALRKQEMVPSMVRNSAGERVQRMVPMTVVKPINGFARCRFVYNSQIDLACYTGTTLPRAQTETVASTLAGTAEAIGHCLTNATLVRSGAEEGSSPVVTFGNGPRHPFWQISMVPIEGDPERVEAEVLVLGPAAVDAPPPPPRRPRAAAKAKAKRG